jgi:hypothetical protein
MSDNIAHVFHIDLIQDIAVIAPVARLVRKIGASQIIVLCTHVFSKRDGRKVWEGELLRFCKEIGAKLIKYDSPLDAHQKLKGLRGIIVAGSESNADAHKATHDLFLSNVPGFLRVTLQHGFECLGFLHNHRHTAQFGGNVGSAADIAAAWFPWPLCRDVPPGLRNRIVVTGPSAKIEAEGQPLQKVSRDPYSGAVCENLHSVRFATDNDKNAFFSDLDQFSRYIRGLGVKTLFRPHPAGQYSLKEGLNIPDCYTLSEGPLRLSEIGKCSYVVSPPSTIVMDFAFAGVPVGLWRGRGDGNVDLGNYNGLRQLGDVHDWWRFVQDANVNTESLMGAQSDFVRRWGIPDDVEKRFTMLLKLAWAH